MGSAGSTMIMFSHTRLTILCIFVHGDKVGTADDYHILVSEHETLDWVYGTQPSSRAVSCDLEVGQGADCYLGQGVYSDGICVEALGFIKPSERNIFMTGYGKVETCPAYMFLVLADKT